MAEKFSKPKERNIVIGSTEDPNKMNLITSLHIIKMAELKKIANDSKGKRRSQL